MFDKFYLGDLAAVALGLATTGLARQQNQAPFNQPDQVTAPARKLKSLAPGYQKVGGSRTIGPHFDPDRNRSRSFQVLVAGLRQLAVD